VVMVVMLLLVESSPTSGERSLMLLLLDQLAPVGIVSTAEGMKGLRVDAAGGTGRGLAKRARRPL
jgi:hypothetical protein